MSIDFPQESCDTGDPSTLYWLAICLYSVLAFICDTLARSCLFSSDEADRTTITHCGFFVPFFPLVVVGQMSSERGYTSPLLRVQQAGLTCFSYFDGTQASGTDTGQSVPWERVHRPLSWKELSGSDIVEGQADVADGGERAWWRQDLCSLSDGADQGNMFHLY